MAAPDDTAWDDHCSAGLDEVHMSMDPLLGLHQEYSHKAQAEHGILCLDLVLW
jgi:hypothetical protein